MLKGKKVIIDYENAKSHLKETCRSEKRPCLDLRVLGTVGHVCIIAAESQNSNVELTRLFIGQGPIALDYTALALRLPARGEHVSSQAASAVQVTQKPTANNGRQGAVTV